MIQFVLLILGVIYTFRRAKVKKMTVEQLPEISPEVFAEWRALELKRISLALWAIWGVLIAGTAIIIVLAIVSPEIMLLVNGFFSAVGIGVVAVVVLSGRKNSKLNRRFDIKLTTKNSPPVPLLGKQIAVTLSADQLQHAYDYTCLNDMLSKTAFGSIGAGALNFWIGLETIRQHPVNLIVLLLGVFLLCEGFCVWRFLKRRVEVFIIDSIALCFAGLWNFFVSLQYAGDYGVFLGGLASAQIAWGIKQAANYYRFVSLAKDAPSDEAIQQANALARKFEEAKKVRSPLLIGFQTVTFVGGKRNWTGWFTGDIAVFMDDSKKELIYEDRSHVQILVNKTTSPEQPIKVTFIVRDNELSGTIAPRHLATFETWKCRDVNDVG